MNNGIWLVPPVFFCVLFWLEGIKPHLARAMDRIQHALPNLTIALIAVAINFSFIVLVTQKVMYWHQSNSLGILNRLDFSDSFKIVIAIVLFDLWMYIWHRLNHKAYPLWLLHRAHHSDVNMDVTTALRFHPIEIILSAMFNIGIVVILGMNLSQFLVYNAIMQCVIFFHHSNVGLSETWDRILRLVVVTPNMHRVHHSIENFETNSNYSSIFSCWDRIFATFKKRTDTKNITYGLPNFRQDVWQGLIGFLRIPFIKKGAY